MGTCKSKQKLKDPDDAPYGVNDGTMGTGKYDGDKVITVNIVADKVSIGGTSGGAPKFVREESSLEEEQRESKKLADVYSPEDTTTDGEVVTSTTKSKDYGLYPKIVDVTEKVQHCKGGTESHPKISEVIEKVQHCTGGTDSIEIDGSMEKGLNSILDEGSCRAIVKSFSADGLEQAECSKFSIISIRSDGTDESSVQVKSAGVTRQFGATSERSDSHGTDSNKQSERVVESLVRHESANSRCSETEETDHDITSGEQNGGEYVNDILSGSSGADRIVGNQDTVMNGQHDATSTHLNYQEQSNGGKSRSSGIEITNGSRGEIQYMPHNSSPAQFPDEVNGHSTPITEYFSSQSDIQPDGNRSQTLSESTVSVSSVDTSALFGSCQQPACTSPRNRTPMTAQTSYTSDVYSNDDVEHDAEMAQLDDVVQPQPCQDHNATKEEEKQKNGEMVIKVIKSITTDLGQYSMDRNFNIAIEGDDSAKIANGKEIGSTARYLASQVKEIAVSCF